MISPFKRILSYIERPYLLFFLAALSLLFFSLVSRLESLVLALLATGGRETGGAHALTLFQRLTVQFPFFMEGLTGLILLLFSTAVIKSGMLFWSRYMTQLLPIRVSRDLRNRAFADLQGRSLSFHRRQKVGGLSSRIIEDSQEIAFGLQSFVLGILYTPLAVVSSLTICCYISWKLTVLVVGILPLVILPMIFFGKKMKQLAHRVQADKEDVSSTMIDYLQGISTIQLFGMEPFVSDAYQKKNGEMAKRQARRSWHELVASPLLHLVTTPCLGLTLLVGIQIFQIPFSELFAFVLLLYQGVYEPIRQCADHQMVLKKGRAAAERWLSLVTGGSSFSLGNQTPWDHKFTHLAFQGVSFSYGQEWALQDIHFAFAAGKRIALVGKSGSGKSTLSSLITRLESAQRGQILLNGAPLESYDVRSLREGIGVVSQDVVLFNDTVAQNIAHGREFSMEEIMEAAKAASAHDFIEALPDGYATVLSRGGRGLSGGQMQRIAIARALIKWPPLLILDEATSALDALCQHEVQSILDQHQQQGGTQLVITHHWETLCGADHLLFLEGGKQLGWGTKEELWERCPPFRAMWRGQSLSSFSL
ncbi:MAG: ABC transporter ATP-binding protein [Chlamydiota bacterium]|nr:ABC transporter ATP-binding protein [Chlamydiota bacterium]